MVYKTKRETVIETNGGEQLTCGEESCGPGEHGAADKACKKSNIYGCPAGYNHAGWKTAGAGCCRGFMCSSGVSKYYRKCQAKSVSDPYWNQFGPKTTKEKTKCCHEGGAECFDFQPDTAKCKNHMINYCSGQIQMSNKEKLMGEWKSNGKVICTITLENDKLVLNYTSSKYYISSLTNTTFAISGNFGNGSANWSWNVKKGAKINWANGIMYYKEPGNIIDTSINILNDSGDMSNGTGVFFTEECQSFYIEADHKDEERAVIQKMCRRPENWAKPQCIKWCNENASNKTFCSSFVESPENCGTASNPGKKYDNPECRCHKLLPTQSGYEKISSKFADYTSCFINDCGYHTTKHCPESIKNCEQHLSASTGGKALDNTQTQNCGDMDPELLAELKKQYNVGSEKEEDNGTTPDENPNDKNPNDKNKSNEENNNKSNEENNNKPDNGKKNNNLWIGLGIVLILFIIIILMSNSSSKPSYNSYYQ